MRNLTLAVAALGAAFLMSGCSDKISDVTGTTLAERCGGYQSVLAGLDMIRSQRELSEDEASRRAIYEGLIITFCPAAAAPTI